MKKILNLGVFSVAILVTTVVSLGCNFWFFYSLFGGQGNEAIAAGCSGCAIQLFGYGFSMYLARAKWYFKPVVGLVAILPLMLSMFTTFTTVYGFVANESIKQQNISKRDEYIYSSLEQSKAAQKLLQQTAEQGLTVRARSQVERLIKSGNEAKALDAELIKQISVNQTQDKKTSPLDGLILIAGEKEKTLKLFCFILSALFDMLPVIALMLLGNDDKSAKEKHIFSQSEEQMTENLNVVEPITPESDFKESGDEEFHKETALPENVVLFVHKQSVNDTEDDKSEVTEDNVIAKIDYETIMAAIMERKIAPSYKEVQSFANFSQWETQKFFKWAQTEGKISRLKANKFEVCV